ncbi:MAG: choice-of-anchor J domain-containing protein [candidate division KSB1 bacterium]|nr:choice-of-anchor J domain-containing protein [candidate division KSB1 bacterium]
MRHRIAAITVVAALLMGGLAWASARSAGNASQLQTAKKARLPESTIHFESAATQGLILWSDDFEGTQPNWVTDASWNLVSTPSGQGRVFQPQTAWELTEANAHSPTHSWHAKVNLNEELDFVISPVIQLPTQVDVGGVASPLKGLKLGYFYDVDAPADTFYFAHLVGKVETWWHFTGDNPGSGTSSWFMQPQDIPHWRQWLITPEIDLTNAVAPVTLSFKHRYDSEPEFDYYSVDVSTDNFRSYTCLAWWDGSNPQPAWTDVTLDLSPWAGQVIKIRFSSKGDYGTAQGYWGLDDIVVQDVSTTFFTDDGGETGSSAMVADGFVPGNRFSLMNATGVAHPEPTWTEMAAINVPNFGTLIKPGDKIRIAFQLIADGSGTTERGLFIDDVTLYGIGRLSYDVQALGVKGLEMAVVGKPLAPVVVVSNAGLQPITGTLRWTGDIYEQIGDSLVKVWPNMFGTLNVTAFQADSVVGIPVAPARIWQVPKPGNYVFKAKVSAPSDGDLTNNEVEASFEVLGPPLQEVVWRCDFEPRGGEKRLEDFGFRVVNGGGNSLTGSNVNTWEYAGFIFGEGSALISYAWGHLDPGPDQAAPYDSSEVLDEYLITPPIDISGLEREGSLYMQYYVYFRTSHPSIGPPFGMQNTDFNIDWSIDGGATWTRAFHWEDHDGLVSDLTRLPNYYYGTSRVISYLSQLGVDLTPALRKGGRTLLIRFHLKSDNSYVVGVNIDNIIVYSGLAHPFIESVVDAPQDNGKQVVVTWRSSFSEQQTIWVEKLYGQFEQREITHYNLWRKDPVGGNAKVTRRVADVQTMLASPGQPGDVFQVENEYWTYVAQIPKLHLAGYRYVAPTLLDGVPTSFMVSAHTSDPSVFVKSNIVQGTSVDNLAPAAPAVVTATQVNYKVQLTWEPSRDEVSGPKDVRYYNVYRCLVGGTFGEPIARVAGHEYLDTSVEIDKRYQYAVSATDHAGNEGEKSAPVTVLVSGVAQVGGELPKEFALEQNYPNPFNPTTTVSFALPKAAHVTLEVYNAAGQRVAVLVDKDMPAGTYKATWDASGMASGVYFCRIQAAEFTAMRKMTLVR